MWNHSCVHAIAFSTSSTFESHINSTITGIQDFLETFQGLEELFFSADLDSYLYSRAVSLWRAALRHRSTLKRVVYYENIQHIGGLTWRRLQGGRVRQENIFVVSTWSVLVFCPFLMTYWYETSEISQKKKRKEKKADIYHRIS